MKKITLSLAFAIALLVCSFSGVSAYAADASRTSIANAEVVTKYESYEYRFDVIEPNVKVYITKPNSKGKMKRVKLTLGEDFTVKYIDNINVGTATIKVKGVGSYKGTALGSFEITPLDINSAGFEFANIQKAYAGTAPDYTVSYKGIELVNGTDYSVSAKRYKKTGYQTSIVKISGIGSISGTKTIYASIYPNKVKSVKLKKLKKNSVKLSWKSLKKEGVTGYKVFAVDKNGNIIYTAAIVQKNSAVIKGLEKGGVYRFRVEGYTENDGKTVEGKLSKKVTTFTKPAKTTAKYACRVSKKKINVAWKSVNCSGYEIAYSTDKNFAEDVHYAYAGKNKTEKRIKVEKSSGTSYYAKVRAYTKYKGKKYYGKWSKAYQTEFKDIYEFYSTYYVNNPNRTTNLKIASKAIDGTIVYPGETFSFNNVVGVRTEAKGYKKAPVFVGADRTEDGVGGGICQVASTIFNAALYCNFTIVERHQHSQRISYCPLGRDAAIYWGSEDLKFKNTTKYPALIKMICQDGKLTCNIYTNSGKKPPTVKLEVKSNDKKFTLYQYVNGKVNYTTTSYY